MSFSGIGSRRFVLMKKYFINGKPYWGGKNLKLGFLIYDPSAQLGLAEDQVRLFIVKEMRSVPFFKKISRTKFVQCNEEELSSLKKAVYAYANLRLNQRVTHCYRCKKDLNSVDFSICNRCAWIRCSCGACGCGYNNSFSASDARKKKK